MSSAISTGNKYWIAFANAKICNHYKSLVEQGFINWRKSRTNFKVGDIVFLFSSVERRIIFKTTVTGIEPRKDHAYWLVQPQMQETWRLEAVEENITDKLYEEDLIQHGFKGGRSLQHPMCNNMELIEYIKSLL